MLVTYLEKDKGHKFYGFTYARADKQMVTLNFLLSMNQSKPTPIYICKQSNRRTKN